MCDSQKPERKMTMPATRTTSALIRNAIAALRALGKELIAEIPHFSIVCAITVAVFYVLAKLFCL